jgi:uncharacterized protein (TIGR00730 family)
VTVSVVCVFCSASPHIDRAYTDTAYEVGACLARAGYAVLTGGGSRGAMGAVLDGARASGGQTIGILPTSLLDREVPDDGCELVLVPDLRTRKRIMDERSEAFVALPGGLGTLEELLEVWVAAALGAHRKPVVVLDGGFYRPLRDLVDQLVVGRFVAADALRALTWADSPSDLVRHLGRRLTATPTSSRGASTSVGDHRVEPELRRRG